MAVVTDWLRHQEFSAAVSGAQPKSLADGGSAPPLDMATLNGRSAKFAAGEDISPNIIFGCNLSWVSFTCLGWSNISWHNYYWVLMILFVKIIWLRWSATPGIPIIETAVKFLQNGRFRRPATAEKIVLYADPSVTAPSERLFKRLSPEEEHHAIILATARDLAKNVMIQEWAEIWLTQPVTFRCVKKLQNLKTAVQDEIQCALFFEASQLREKIGEDFESMYLTTVSGFNLFNPFFKSLIKKAQFPSFRFNGSSRLGSWPNRWRVNRAGWTLPRIATVHQAFQGNLRVSSGESITVTFVKVALAIWKVLRNTDVRNALLLGDELFGKQNPISNSLYKLEALIQACGSDAAKVHLMITAVFDMVLNGDLQAWECSWGPFTGKKQPQNKGYLG